MPHITQHLTDQENLVFNCAARHGLCIVELSKAAVDHLKADPTLGNIEARHLVGIQRVLENTIAKNMMMNAFPEQLLEIIIKDLAASQGGWVRMRGHRRPRATDGLLLLVVLPTVGRNDFEAQSILPTFSSLSGCIESMASQSAQLSRGWEDRDSRSMKRELSTQAFNARTLRRFVVYASNRLEALGVPKQVQLESFWLFCSVLYLSIADLTARPAPDKPAFHITFQTSRHAFSIKTYLNESVYVMRAIVQGLMEPIELANVIYGSNTTVMSREITALTSRAKELLQNAQTEAV